MKADKVKLTRDGKAFIYFCGKASYIKELVAPVPGFVNKIKNYSHANMLDIVYGAFRLTLHLLKSN